MKKNAISPHILAKNRSKICKFDKVCEQSEEWGHINRYQ